MINKIFKLSLLLLLLIISQFSIGQVVINELDCDTPGTDDKEFIELKSDVPNFDLEGFVLVFFTILDEIGWEIYAGGHLKGISKILKNDCLLSCSYTIFDLPSTNLTH